MPADITKVVLLANCVFVCMTSGPTYFPIGQTVILKVTETVALPKSAWRLTKQVRVHLRTRSVQTGVRTDKAN